MTILTSPEEIIKDKTAVEAGYVHDPDDLGGETIWGITKETAYEDEYRPLWQKYGWNGDMKTMPKALAYDIYKQGWWNRMNLDHIAQYSWPLAERLFDFGINAGRVNCAQSFQMCLNVLNKGQTLYPDINPLGTIIGPQTIRTLDAAVIAFAKDATFIEKLTMMMFSMQTYHYVRISNEREKNERFTMGWINRVWRDFRIYANWLSGG